MDSHRVNPTNFENQVYIFKRKKKVITSQAAHNVLDSGGTFFLSETVYI